MEREFGSETGMVGPAAAAAVALADTVKISGLKVRMEMLAPQH
jgi:hypothetical protein